jgi:hypothetical protein
MMIDPTIFTRTRRMLPWVDGFAGALHCRSAPAMLYFTSTRLYYPCTYGMCAAGSWQTRMTLVLCCGPNPPPPSAACL